MSIDLGLVPLLGADAVGQPGERRFRLFTRSGRGSAIMWMEKEQLAGLSEVLDRSLAYVTEGQILRVEAQAIGMSSVEGIPDDFPRHPTSEGQVGQMRLTYDEAEGNFVLNVVPLDIQIDAGTEEPQVVMRYDDAVSFAFTLLQAQSLSQTIQHVLTSGRPVCPLCHMPLDGGPHACVKQNGHREIIQIEEGGEGEEEEEE